MLVDNLDTRIEALLNAFKGLAIATYYHSPSDLEERRKQVLEYVAPVRGVDASIQHLYSTMHAH